MYRLAFAAMFLCWAQTAVAQPDDAASTPKDAPADAAEDDGSYWSVTFLGSLLTPTAALTDTHEPGLASSMVVGFTGSSGLGLQLGAAYSPFPRVMPAGAEVISHFGMATVAPTFTAGRGVLRLSLGAGGAGLLERTTTTLAGMSSQTELTRAAGAYGTAGLELHLFEGGGPMVSGSYFHSLTGDRYTLYALSAGVTFAF